MTSSRAHRLAARHLRFQQALFALRREIVRLPSQGSVEGWEAWLERREEVLREIARHQGPRLAAETADFLRDGDPGPLGRWVRLLHAQSLEMLREMAARETLLERVIGLEVLALSRRLLTARGAATARDGYRPPPGARPRLDHQG